MASTGEVPGQVAARRLMAGALRLLGTIGLPSTFPGVLAAGGIALAGVAALLLFAGSNTGRAPPGLAKTNGRIEIERVDIASKYAGRLARIDIKEGDDVTPGQTIALMDVAELNAQLAAAKAVVRRSTQAIERAKAAK